jgi:hypothetical protein
MEAAVFAEALEDSEDLTWIIPESRSFTQTESVQTI